MVRRKTKSTISVGCLILLFWGQSSQAQSFKLGKITQVHGEITYLPYKAPNKVATVKVNEDLKGEGSYLTQPGANFTVHLFDGSYIRISPSTKFSLEFDPTSKTTTLNLFTGSFKALYSATLSKDISEKFIVKSADATFEATEAKFCIVRNPLSDTSSVYVEKGAVVAIQNSFNEDKKDVELVHTHEMASVKDRGTEIETPRKMSEKELKFLQSSNYLKLNGQTEI